MSMFIALPVMAECDEGWSEIIITTGNGSKIRCVPDQAIKGIENAPEGAGVSIAATCPCLDVWDGEPYGSEVLLDGIPPVLPYEIVSSDTCSYGNNGDAAFVQFSRKVTDPGQGTIIFGASIQPYGGGATLFQQCFAAFSADVSIPDGGAAINVSDGSLFSDAVSTGNGYTSPMMDACKRLLEERGCEF